MCHLGQLKGGSVWFQLGSYGCVQANTVTVREPGKKLRAFRLVRCSGLRYGLAVGLCPGLAVGLCPELAVDDDGRVCQVENHLGRRRPSGLPMLGVMSRLRHAASSRGCLGGKPSSL